MQLQPVYQTQWIQRKHTQTHTHTHTMSSREKLHSLFSISFFANISQQFMLFFFFLSTFGLLFFFQLSHLFLFFAFITTYENHGVSTTADQDTVTDFFFRWTFYIVQLHGKKKSQSSICLTRWLKNSLMSWGERLDAVSFMFISGLLDMLSKADCCRLRVTID